MKQELNDFELEDVTGGSVTLSATMGAVYFDSMDRSFKIKGDIKEMRKLLTSLYDTYGDTMSNAEFDKMVAKEYRSRGWI